ncbi:MAG: MFS transporter [Acidimicrobiia bacterium]|nr:MFS transporter [Acidimicrobiia bacterium]
MSRRLVPDHVLALVAVFLTAYATNVSTPFLVLYRDRLDLGPTQTQFIFVIYVGGILTTLLIAGPLSDRFGRRPMCVPFVALSAVASLLILFGRNSYPLLLVGRLFLGVAVGAVLAVGTAWVQELMGSDGRVRAAVLTTLATYAGFGLGPAISAALERLAPAPLVTPFVVHVATTAMVLPLLATIAETRPQEAAQRPVRLNLGIPPTDKRLFWLAVVPAAIWVFAFPSTSFALFPVLLSSAMGGYEVQVAGVAAMLTAWSGMVARPLLPRVGPIGCLSVGMGLGFVGYLLGTTAFITDAWPLLLPSAMSLGAASGCITAGCLALLGIMAEDTRRGALTSTFYLLAYPSMSMPVLVTSLASVWTDRTALILITACSLAGGILVVVAGRVMAPEQRGLLARV